MKFFGNPFASQQMTDDTSASLPQYHKHHSTVVSAPSRKPSRTCCCILLVLMLGIGAVVGITYVAKLHTKQTVAIIFTTTASVTVPSTMISGSSTPVPPTFVLPTQPLPTLPLQASDPQLGYQNVLQSSGGNNSALAGHKVRRQLLVPDVHLDHLDSDDNGIPDKPITFTSGPSSTDILELSQSEARVLCEPNEMNQREGEERWFCLDTGEDDQSLVEPVDPDVENREKEDDFIISLPIPGGM